MDYVPLSRIQENCKYIMEITQIANFIVVHVLTAYFEEIETYLWNLGMPCKFIHDPIIEDEPFNSSTTEKYSS